MTSVVGHRFPGGAYHLPDYVSWLWTDAVTAAPDPAAAHPGIAYMVALHGGRASIQDIMDLLGTAADAGVQFGEVAFEFDGVLSPGATYQVDGEVLAVQRKAGRRTGPFDLATFQHRLREQAGGPPVATVTHTWVVPRPEAAS